MQPKEILYVFENGSSSENSPRNFRPPNRVPSSRAQGQVQKEDITERKCPVCSYYFPNLSVQEFQEHVETHFEDDPTDFFELTHVEWPTFLPIPRKILDFALSNHCRWLISLFKEWNCYRCCFPSQWECIFTCLPDTKSASRRRSTRMSSLLASLRLRSLRATG